MRAAAPRPALSLPWVGALLALFLASQYGYALRVPFINDDFVFLDATRAASFASLWGMRSLAFHWYRPWSRELHYWTLQRLFGANEAPFHLASWALWLSVMVLFFALARRRAGTAGAAVATGGLAALAAWGVPLVWAAGVQDLWMMLWALLALEALDRARPWLAAAATALALLSKETAALLPGLAFAHALLLDRRPLRAALARAAPLALVTLAWAIVHPLLGGRLGSHVVETGAPPAAAALHPGMVSVAARTLLMTLNLDEIPRPEFGWVPILPMALGGALILGLLATLGAWPAGSRADVSRATQPALAPVLAFGSAWAGLGWLPLLLPSIGWHAYYALFGACGAWLALGALLARRPTLGIALVVALALVRPGRATTVSRDWGSEWYQRRAAEFLSGMHADLMIKHPSFPPHSRLYFIGVPSNIGFLPGDGPSLRIWYHDATLSGGLFSSFRAHIASGTPGGDYFFRYDSLAGWIEIAPGPEDVAHSRASNPRWALDHEALAGALAQGGDFAAAAGEFEKLAAVFPLNPDYAYDAGVCEKDRGDSLAADRWLERAASLPAADDTIRAVAGEFHRLLQRPR